MRAKVREQVEARRLRADGRSLREISRELGVALSSVSVWTRDAPKPMPPAQPTPRVAWEAAQICNGCGRMLLASDFHQGQARCKECRREYIRERGKLHRQQTRRARDKRRAAARAYVLSVLGAGRCADCRLADAAVLEFDHVGPKRAEVGKLVREGYRLNRIKAEIEKCELVCANCHRRRTAARVRSWRVEPTWRAARSNRPLRARNLLFLLEYLRTRSCVDCGAADPVVLDFDHVGEKRWGVVQLAGRECSLTALGQEIAQCEVRCANCHRRRTIVQQQHFRHHLVTPP
jgi:DNA-directed RNA polymerase subunit M/transcription elongation factor TFIIS